MDTHITAFGNASRNAELKQSSRGNEYAVVNMAVTIEDRRDENDNPPPWWLRVMAFRKTADQLCEVRKGDRIGVTGTLKRSRYTAQNGEPREGWTVFADQVHSVRRPDRESAQDGQHPRQSGGTASGRQRRQEPQGDDFDNMDDVDMDGIPF